MLKVVQRVAPRVRRVTRVDIAIDAYLKTRSQQEAILAIIEEKVGEDCMADAIRWGVAHPVEIAAEFSERICRELDRYRMRMRRGARFLDMAVERCETSCRAGLKRRMRTRRREVEIDAKRLEYIGIWATMLAADHAGESQAVTILEGLLNALIEERTISELLCFVLRNKKGTPNPPLTE